MAVTPIPVSELTGATISGSGVFDVLMRATKAHLDAEFEKNRIKGPEYATVYLGSLQSVLTSSMNFLLESKKGTLEAQLLEKQVEIAELQRQKAVAELAIVQANIPKVAAEIAQIEAQTLLITQQKANLLAEAANIPKQGALLDAQASLAAKQVLIADEEIAIKQAQVDVALAEVGIAEAKLVNVPKEGAVLDAEAALKAQQTLNLVSEELQIDAKTAQITAELLNIPKQGVVLDAEAELKTQQKLNLESERMTTEAKTAQIEAETLNVPKQGLAIDAEKDLKVQQKLNLISEELGIDAKTSLTQAQVASETLRNFIHPTDPTLSGAVEQERRVLLAQKCKLDAEFDNLLLVKLKTTSETNLLDQKFATEKAQISSVGVDATSILGRQAALYLAQTNGFTRDAEQKAAKLMVDSWNVRRTTDEATSANTTNKLDDASVGRAVDKLLAGVGA